MKQISERIFYVGVNDDDKELLKTQLETYAKTL